MKKLLVKGFTLIELLVVISIIAILASMLMPALSGAKEKANSVKSIANLKALGTSMAMYAMDNKDIFPGADTQDETGVRKTFKVLIDDQKISLKVFECPGFPSTPVDSGTEVIGSAYGLNVVTMDRSTARSTTIHVGDSPVYWGGNKFFNALFTDASVKEIKNWKEDIDPELADAKYDTNVKKAYDGEGVLSGDDLYADFLMITTTTL